MKVLINLLDILLRQLSYNSLTSLGRILGTIAFYILPSRRKVAIKNAQIIGIKDPYNVAKESFKNSFASFLEVFFIKKIDTSFLEKHVIINNDDVNKILNLNETFGPYFVVSAHIGSWEIVPKLFTLKFDKVVCIVGRKIKNSNIDNLIKRLRSDEKIIYLSHRNIAFEISKLVDKKIIVGTLLDHSALKKDSIYVDFFGLKTSFIAGIPILSAKKNIPVVPVFCIRVDKHTLKIICYDPIFPDKNLKPGERILNIAEKINSVYEDIIKKYPEQWYLMHKRFKRVKKDDNQEETYSIYR
ncbi:MAG: Kdo2-lipid lauroyltransferase/acyltransferase [Deferribacteres bacterium]|jgi:KDO2-lipid IV(A) lauroyltransferase|nr:lipid biosynthesis lauroyl acyltransferase [Deferribacteraceae bacterium]MDK2791788.1 Kdo2-lipid lauroyltransferase/acyltransferase [Deferribacteres bacterium]